jgi:hypothetical protein
MFCFAGIFFYKKIVYICKIIYSQRKQIFSVGETLFDNTINDKMKIRKKFTFLFMLSILFAGIACERDEKEDITCYDAAGAGHIFIYDTLNNTSYPPHGKDIMIKIMSYLERCGFSTPGKETFTVDKTGKYWVSG